MARRKGGQSAVPEDGPPEPAYDYGMLPRRSTRIAQNESKQAAEMARNSSATDDVENIDSFQNSTAVALSLEVRVPALFASTY